MKKTLGLLALLLLSGCGAGRQAGIPLPQPQPQAEAQATAPLSYPVRVHNAVSREQRLPERARGQRCTISIRLRPDGKLASSKIVRGDAPRCAAASAAVQRAQFPPMANATEYALFNAVVLDFVP
ncbi:MULTISPECIES: cell envelope integrity TolA C-terminal domain-containing protein [Serratia]|uniref:cell envelope integrity TolA C-terminal domain-containing protein n=1 Tax=Serratia TaxID=613 RepID=UPI00074518B0|nr:cell envelope integrity TolA C-terminal domain-containing protein [Serratia marcescens]ASM06201.1 cell envelope biogenesis protein TolA [Serratia marcescens]MBE8816933.1 cell envelope biogenesis protein TolA [Serratia marcescens]MBS6085873.1 cell envelope biogenesis protein TolA [Serratia marcescens]MCG5376499.1 cell envelope biogenesis protein TolA [Serratia marcescens]CVG48102.1 cell envelope integrity inner membrane protein TolA [Serratia marcescens]